MPQNQNLHRHFIFFRSTYRYTWMFTSGDDISFWGSVYSTYFAIPHLRNSKRKFITITLSTGWLCAPRMSFYCASKSAIIAFYETLSERRLKNHFGGKLHLGYMRILEKLVKLQAYGGDRESSGLGDIFDSRVHHLTKTHSVFLQHWSRFIDLESKELQAANTSRRSHNQRSDRSPSCFASVVLDQSQKLPQQKSVKENKFIYRFVRQESPSPDRNTSDGADTSASSSLDYTLKNGDYVILSTKLGNLAVASGVIKDISHHQISVSFSKRLRLSGSKSSSDAQDFFWGGMTVKQRRLLLFVCNTEVQSCTTLPAKCTKLSS